MKKSVEELIRNVSPHWVGDGFYVHSLFGYFNQGALYDPFLLLDHAAPKEFSPSTNVRGVGEHPHRGFETVTLVYQGAIAHRDSAGGGGVIGPGEVQWMTAASGVVHEEFHDREWSKKGGMMEMVQLWVNLPAKLKMSPPKYQALTKIPELDLGTARLRIVAGDYQGIKGAAETYTPMQMIDISLQAATTLQVPEGHTCLVLVRRGHLTLGETTNLKESDFIRCSRQGDELHLIPEEPCELLLLTGEPIGESIFGHGPFVMNTREEIIQAIEDFNSGRMGRLE